MIALCYAIRYDWVEPDIGMPPGPDAVEAGKTAAFLEARAAAFDAGTVNAQGRSLSPGSTARRERRQQSQGRREDRIAAARAARAGQSAWAVTRAVYADATGQLAGSGRRLVEADHEEAVRAAVAAGEPVPEGVRADYPDLTTTLPVVSYT